MNNKSWKGGLMNHNISESAVGKREDYQGKTNPCHNALCTWPCPKPHGSSLPVPVVCWQLHCHFWSFWPFFFFTVLF